MNEKAEQEEKELVCIFLGLEFYILPGKARILKSKITDVLLRNLSREDLVAIETRPMVPAIDLTPTFSMIRNKLTKNKK